MYAGIVGLADPMKLGYFVKRYFFLQKQWRYTAASTRYNDNGLDTVTS